MQVLGEGRPFGRRFGAAFVAACTIGAGLGVTPAAALQLCDLLGNCAPTTTMATVSAPDPGGRETPDQTVSARGGKAFGFNSALTLSGLASPEVELDEVQRAGGRYLRMSIGWGWLQPSPADQPIPAPHAGSTVVLLDELYRRALARGVRLILIPGAAPLWATATPPASSCRRAAYRPRRTTRAGSGRTASPRTRRTMRPSARSCARSRRAGRRS